GGGNPPPGLSPNQPQRNSSMPETNGSVSRIAHISKALEALDSPTPNLSEQLKRLAQAPTPTPPEEGSAPRRTRRIDGLPKESGGRQWGGVTGELARFLADYILLPEDFLLAVCAWVQAAWLADLWDRFPHLCISSPDRQCGKSRFLEL